MTNKRSSLRGAALKGKSLRRAEFTYNDETFELIAPTVKERQIAKAKATEKGEVDDLKFAFLLLIACVVEPGTDTRVLEESDFDFFMEARDTDFAEAAAPALSELLGKEVKK